MENLKLTEVVWHYTYSNNINAILASRVLLPPAALSARSYGMTESAAKHMGRKACARRCAHCWRGPTQIRERFRLEEMMQMFSVGTGVDVHDILKRWQEPLSK
jgi:hypothetical protein